MIRLSVNGESRSTSVATITELVAELGFPPQTLLIEHNGTALHRGDWTGISLVDGDRIELLRVTAGG